LQRVDKLRVETRSNFDTHAADEQVEVHDSEIRFLVPRYFVLLDHACDDWVGPMPGVRFEDTHYGGVGEAQVCRNGCKATKVNPDLILQRSSG
jgi:hypothetical protein